MFTQVPPLVAAQGTGSQLLQFPATPMLSAGRSLWMQLSQDVARATSQMQSTFPFPAPFPLPAACAPLLEWKGAVKVCPWLGSLTRRVLAIPATSAAPERLFSYSGNTMTKKRTRLTCDNLEELVFLHETWPVVREWEANKRVRIDEKAEEAVDLTNE